MKIEIESTTDLVDHNGAPARIWQGVTENGAKCSLLVSMITVHKDEDNDLFQKELMETTLRAPDDGPWDARMFAG